MNPDLLLGRTISLFVAPWVQRRVGLRAGNASDAAAIALIALPHQGEPRQL